MIDDGDDLTAGDKEALLIVSAFALMALAVMVALVIFAPDTSAKGECTCDCTCCCERGGR